VAAALILSPQARAAQVAAVVRKNQQSCPESFYCWRSGSSPSGRAFLIICRAPPAVVAGQAEYMSASEGSVLEPAQGKGGRGRQQRGRDEAVQY